MRSAWRLPGAVRSLLVWFAVAACGAAVPAQSKTDAETRQQISALEDRRSLGKGRLDALLKDSDAETRALAARALGRIGLEASVSALLPAIDDADPEVRREAIFALGQIGAPSARAKLVGAAQNGKTIEERREAVIALGKLRSEKPGASSSSVIPFLKDSNALVRADACIALARTADSAATDPLRPLLKDQILRSKRMPPGQREDWAPAVFPPSCALFFRRRIPKSNRWPRAPPDKAPIPHRSSLFPFWPRMPIGKCAQTPRGRSAK